MAQIILIVLGVVIVALLLTRKTRESIRQAQDKVVGICAAAIGLDAPSLIDLRIGLSMRKTVIIVRLAHHKMKKLRCGTEPAWELLRSDIASIASRRQKSMVIHSP